MAVPPAFALASALAAVFLGGGECGNTATVIRACTGSATFGMAGLVVTPVLSIVVFARAGSRHPVLATLLGGILAGLTIRLLAPLWSRYWFDRVNSTGALLAAIIGLLVLGALTLWIFLMLSDRLLGRVP